MVGAAPGVGALPLLRPEADGHAGVPRSRTSRATFARNIVNVALSSDGVRSYLYHCRSVRTRAHSGDAQAKIRLQVAAGRGS
jgi:hypothetical protein